MATDESETVTTDDGRTTAPLWLNALAVYYFTTLLVGLGFSFGFDLLKRGPGAVRNVEGTLDAATSADGIWYKHIVEDGYFYDPARRSSVAYFPAYPLVARLAAWATGVRAGTALLIVSNASFFAAIVVAFRYLRARQPSLGGGDAAGAIIILCLFPTGCFFRLACSESPFLLCCVAILYANARRWPLVAVAMLTGLATATRPVGVAALAPFLMGVWGRGGSLPQRLRRLVLLLPLSLWGLEAFMVYQQWAFGDALAFAKTQQHFRVCPPVAPASKLLALLELEPVRSVYDPASPAFWKRRDPHVQPWLSLHFANPLFFLGTAGVIVFAAYRRWLSNAEMAMAAMLLAIPYVTRAQEMGMGSMGRFVAVVFPLYPALAKIALALPPIVRYALAGLSAFYLSAYAALFAAGYNVY